MVQKMTHFLPSRGKENCNPTRPTTHLLPNPTPDLVSLPSKLASTCARRSIPYTRSVGRSRLDLEEGDASHPVKLSLPPPWKREREIWERDEHSVVLADPVRSPRLRSRILIGCHRDRTAIYPHPAGPKSTAREGSRSAWLETDERRVE